MELGLFTTCWREGESQVERLASCARRMSGSPLEDAGSTPATSTPVNRGPVVRESGHGALCSPGPRSSEVSWTTVRVVFGVVGSGRGPNDDFLARGVAH